MLFSRGDIHYVLSQFDAGIQLVQIINDLHLAAIEQCLHEHGRQISNNQPSDAGHDDQSHEANRSSNPPWATNHAALGPPTANQEARQVSAHPAVLNSTTDALYDPGPTMSWDAQADRFTIAAHRFGNSAAEIWATLRSNGYDIAQTEVIASLIGQGVSTGNRNREKPGNGLWGIFLFDE